MSERTENQSPLNRSANGTSENNRKEGSIRGITYSAEQPSIESSEVGCWLGVVSAARPRRARTGQEAMSFRLDESRGAQAPMADVVAWHRRFTLEGEHLLDVAEDIEGEDLAGAEKVHVTAREWRGMAAWLLEHADKLPPLPEVSDALDFTGAVGFELRLDR